MTMLFPSRAFRRQRERTPGQLFAFGVDDVTLDIPTGQTLTFDRNSGRTVLDSQGRVATLAYDQVPWSAVYNSVAGVWEPTYEPMQATTNLCLRSEDFGTTWSGVGTPTRSAAAKRCGDLVLDLIGDDAGGTLEGYTQAVTFTGNAVKAVAVFVAKATSTSSVIRVRDTSAGANRLLATVTWSGSTPSVAMTTGTHIGSVACYDGVYRLLFQTTSVTAANTNQIEVYPATNAALTTSSTGTLYVGGVQAENHLYPRAYVKTLGSTVTTSADKLTCPLALPLTDFTVYGRVARPTWIDLSGVTPPMIVSYQDDATGGFYIEYQSGPFVTAVIADNTGSTNTKSASVPATGVFEFAVQFQTLTTDPVVRLDVGSGFTAWSSSVLTGMTSWGAANTLCLGQFDTTTFQCDAGIRRIAIAYGLRTLDEMRGPQP